MKLSILMPTLERRSEWREYLIAKIAWQCFGVGPSFDERYGSIYRISGNDYEIITDNHETDAIGVKRNRLLQAAYGEYVCFIDDDDNIAENYIKLVRGGIDNNTDCCSLLGIITFDGHRPQEFRHSIKYKRYEEVDGVFLRYPNHLNTIRTSIAKKFTFPETNHGEDTDWATQIFNSGLLKTEHEIKDILYYYLYKTVK